MIPHIISFGLLFSIIYPLCFWMKWLKAPFMDDFYKLHIALPNLVGGMTTVFVLFSNFPLIIKIAVVSWKAIFIIVSYLFWKKKILDVRLVSISTAVGLYALYQVFCWGG